MICTHLEEGAARPIMILSKHTTLPRPIELVAMPKTMHGFVGEHRLPEVYQRRLQVLFGATHFGNPKNVCSLVRTSPNSNSMIARCSFMNSWIAGVPVVEIC